MKTIGFPLMPVSSPIPLRKTETCINRMTASSVEAIKKALLEKATLKDIKEKKDLYKLRKKQSPSSLCKNCLLGSFEESILNGRLQPESKVDGFVADIGASGAFYPDHIKLPASTSYYSVDNADRISTPYSCHVNLTKKGYRVPRKGTVQVTLFNPHGSVVKIFVVPYDFTDMPAYCHTFLRQRTLHMPIDGSEKDPRSGKWLRYLIHLRFASSKSGRIYIHTDIKTIILRKSDAEAAANYDGQTLYDFREFTTGPTNPRYFTRGS